MSLKFRPTVSDMVSVATSGKAAMNNLPAYTVMAWIFPTVLGALKNHIYARITAGAAERRFYILDATGALRAETDRAGGLSFTESISCVLAKRWNFVAMTFDLTNDNKIYHGLGNKPAKNVDNAINATAGAVSDDSACPIWWGGTDSVATHGQSFEGSIAAVGLWDRVLPLNEIVSQQFHMRPSTGNVDFHVFRPGFRLEAQTDLSWLRRGNPGVMSSTALLTAQSPIYPADPPVEIF